MEPRRPVRDGGSAPEATPASREAAARRAEAPASLPLTPACPFCDGVDTELMNAFGSHASVSTFWCRPCRSPFETVKWRG